MKKLNGQLMLIPQAIEYIKDNYEEDVSKQTLRNWAVKGWQGLRIPYAHRGCHLVVRKDDVDAFMRDRISRR